MYSKYLPEFEKLYAEVGIKVTFGPKSYFATNEPTPIIVMEDLSEYEMTNKAEGFDRTQTEQGLSWMANFHAASMVYKERNGPFGTDFESGLFAMKIEPTYQGFFDSYMDYYVAALKKLPDGEKYLQKVESWRGVLFRMACKTLQYDENAFNVLNHGDAWGNNFMFQFNEDRSVRDTKLVDYQLCYWGSLANDIYYFMMSTWNMEIKVKKFDELIRFYFDNLLKNLKSLDCKKLPTFEDLENELSRRKFLGKLFNFINFLRFHFSTSSGCIDCGNPSFPNVREAHEGRGVSKFILHDSED